MMPGLARAAAPLEWHLLHTESATRHPLT